MTRQRTGPDRLTVNVVAMGLIIAAEILVGAAVIAMIYGKPWWSGPVLFVAGIVTLVVGCAVVWLVARTIAWGICYLAGMGRRDEDTP